MAALRKIKGANITGMWEGHIKMQVHNHGSAKIPYVMAALKSHMYTGAQ